MKNLASVRRWIVCCLFMVSSTLLPAQGQDMAALMEKANGGDSEAQHQVAQRYLNGIGVEKDISKAIIWHRKAAEQGNPASQFFLHYKLNESGALYRDPVEAYMWMHILLDGNPDTTGMFDRSKALESRAKDLTEKQLKEAVDRAKLMQSRIKSAPFENFSRLAAQGDAAAQNDLGTLYLKGEGVPRDPDRAYSLFLKSAEKGLASAQFNLGLCYLDGVGVPKSDEQAFLWFLKAARQEHQMSQYNVGLFLFNGQGVSKNYELGESWLLKADGNGSVEAAFSLGVAYANGLGVGKNLYSAVRFFTKAAIRGDAESMYNVGYSFDRGMGATRNDIDALAWYSLSATKGHKPASVRVVEMKSRMNSDQIELAYAKAIELILDHKIPVPIPQK